MPAPVDIDASRFFEFVGAPGLKVVLISAHPSHTFSQPLADRLAFEHVGIALGTVSLVDLVVRGPSALRFLHQGLAACGAPTALGVVPGYCFFRDAEMLAWDAGLPALDDVGPILRSAALGAVIFGVTREASFVQQAVTAAAEHLAAGRVAYRFGQAQSGRRQSSHAASPGTDDLFWAYQVLGVLPTATDREVHEAWRRRRMECHPDRVASDPAEFARLSQMSTDINRARDIIAAARASGRAA